MGHGAGKVILFGEHAVVYGEPALAAALSRGARAEATGDAGALTVLPWGTRVTLDEPGEGPAEPASDDRAALLARAYRALVAEYAAAARGVGVRATMEIPGGAGLGGSAALGVAVVRALDEALGLAREPAEVAALSLAWERVFHGNPSGVDSAMAAACGVALFVKGRGLEPVRLARPLHLAVAHSGEYGSTKVTVASVAAQREREPARVGAVLTAIGRLATAARAALEAGRLEELGRLMGENHALLAGLGLSTARLDALCEAALAAGALGAKLTGGGGGGCMIALGRDAAGAEAVCAALRERDPSAFVVEVAT